MYWKERLQRVSIDDVCFKIKTNTLENDKGEPEEYYLLCDQLPEDKSLREHLQIFKLVKFK